MGLDLLSLRIEIPLLWRQGVFGTPSCSTAALKLSLQLSESLEISGFRMEDVKMHQQWLGNPNFSLVANGGQG
jgi:hypothetical protein